MPQSRVKVTNLWRQVAQFSKFQHEYQRMIKEAVIDEEIEEDEDKYEMLKDSFNCIDEIRERIEVIRKKCWKFMKKYEMRNKGYEIFRF